MIRKRVINPLFQLFATDSDTGGIVGETKIDHVGALFGQLGQKSVFLPAGHVDDLAPSLALAVLSGSSGHYIGVDVNRVNRVAHRNHVIRAEDIADAAGIAFRAVADKNLIDVNLHPALYKIVFRDCGTKKFITGFRAVAAKGFRFAHLLCGGLHGLYHRFRQRAGNIPDSQADNLRFRVLPGKFVHLFCDIHKKVARGQLYKVFVYS